MSLSAPQWVFLVVVLIARVPASAESGSPVDSLSTAVREQQESGFPAIVLNDQATIWSSPFRMDSAELLFVGGVAAITAFAIAVDEPVNRNVCGFREKNDWVRSVSPVATKLGEFYVPYGIAGSFCLVGLLKGNKEVTDAGLLAAEAMVQSGILIQVLKHLFGRTRPFVHNGRDIWYGPRTFFKRYSDSGFSPYDSFPSGYTITAFSLATVVAERNSDSPLVGYISYSCATLCGLSRLTEHDHWLSDVFVGGVLGIGIGKLVVHNHRQEIALVPTISPGSASIGMQLNFLVPQQLVPVIG